MLGRLKKSLMPRKGRFEDTVKDGLTLSTALSMYILHEADESKFIYAANEIIARNKGNIKSKLFKNQKSTRI